MTAWIDIKYALRLLFKAPKFTALTLFVLIGGLSISLFTFSFLYSFVYTDMPLPESETAKRVMVVVEGDLSDLPAYEFFQIHDQLKNFAEIGVYQDSTIRFSIKEEGKNLLASYVEPGMFHFSRTQPLMGRELYPDDLLADAEPVAVISHKIWQNELLGVPDIVGQSIRLNNIPTTIVGIMPEDYQFPGFTEVWLPMPDGYNRLSAEDQQEIQTYARVKPGISESQAEQELSYAIDPLYQQGVTLYDKSKMPIKIELMSFPMAQTDGDGTLLFIAFNMIALFILLLACINVGNLLLARAIERHKETAIGSTRGTSRPFDFTTDVGRHSDYRGRLLVICFTGGSSSGLHRLADAL